ncbi:MAG: hypothetical protein LIV26_06890 [Atopobium sp.]|jgi:O-antigen/teichoic acid export membrane protein|nr:hypothetical protein [Olegusella sp.]MCC6107483.1 hypothetical protein [Atopobium sp.]
MNFRKLAGNMATAFAAQGVSFLASIAMSLLVPKVLGVATYGYWQLFVFYTTYSGFFALGLNDGVYLIEGGTSREEIDKRAINSQFWVEAVFQVILGFIIGLVATILAPEPQRAFVFGGFAIYTVIFNLSGFLGYVFQSMNETKLYSYSTMIERFVFLIAVIAMVALRVPAFEPYVVAYLISKGCSLGYCCFHARDFFKAGFLGLPESVRLCISSMKVGIALMISNVASMLILGVARALVDNAWGIEAFGRVSFSLSMVNFFIAFVGQASMVLFPALRQGSEQERRSFYRGIRDAMEIAFPLVYILYFPMAAILSLWLPQYADSMHFFAILLPVCVFNTKMDICCTTYFKVLREERTLLKVNVATVLASLILSLIGVYVLGSLDPVLIGAVTAIIGRALWSEHYLNGRLAVSTSRIPIEEVLLTVAFLALTLLTPAAIAICGYAVLYCVYLIANRNVTRGLLQSTRHVLSKGRNG